MSILEWTNLLLGLLVLAIALSNLRFRPSALSFFVCAFTACCCLALSTTSTAWVEELLGKPGMSPTAHARALIAAMIFQTIALAFLAFERFRRRLTSNAHNFPTRMIPVGPTTQYSVAALILICCVFLCWWVTENGSW